MSITRGSLSLVTDGDVIDAPAFTPIDPLRPAGDNTHAGLPVPCPIHDWCMGHEHGETVTAASQHTGEVHGSSVGTLYVDLTGAVASVAYTPDFGETVYLDPDEAIEHAHALITFALAAKAVAA